MKTRHSPLEYPITVRQVEGFLVFAVRDFNISLVEEMPADGRLSSEFMRKVAAAMGRTWLKSNERIKALSAAGKPLPEPSKMRVATRDLKKTKPMTAPQVARLLGVSENSVRRIPKSQLRYRLTKGGHRRYSIGAIRMYREQFEIAENDLEDLSPAKLNLPMEIKSSPERRLEADL